MNLDDFKKPWRQQQHELGQSLDHGIEAVRLRIGWRIFWFELVIWLRDLRESVVAVLVFVWYGYNFFRHPEWLAKFGLVLGMLACTMIVVILNWARLTGRVARLGLPLQDYCMAELARVERQIWLLRNVNWWYTGPLFLPMMIFLFGLAPPAQVLIVSLIFLLPFGWLIYWLNQLAVRSHLLPLRQVLAGAMAMTADDAVAEDGPMCSTPKPRKVNRRGLVLLVIGWLALVAGWLALVAVGIYVGYQFDVDENAPQVSPFTEVRFDGDQVIVTYDGQTYQWLEIDEIKVADIVASSKWRNGFIWQKRMAEDLVDLLWRMNHQPGGTVKLRLLNLKTKQDFVVENAPLTEENRFAVYWNREHAGEEAADGLGADEMADRANSNLAIDEKLRARLVGRYQLAPNFIFDVQDRDGHLMVGITNQPTQEVFPDSATRWSYRGVDATLEFQLGRTGPAKRLVLHQNGIRQTATRIEN